MADKSKTSAVVDWPAPKTVKEIYQFLRLANYYHVFIQKFTTKAGPLTELLQKKVGWKWGSMQQSAFDDLKEALVNPPVL